MDMVSGAATYAQGDTILGTERCLDTWIDPEERAGTLQQRLLKKAGDSQQVKNGSLNGDGWRNFWETREYGQNLLHPLTEVKPGNRETCTRISYKNFFFFFLVVKQNWLCEFESFLKPFGFLWRVQYEKNVSTSPSQSSGEPEVPSQEGHLRLAIFQNSSNEPGMLLLWNLCFLCLWRKNQSHFSRKHSREEKASWGRRPNRVPTIWKSTSIWNSCR